MQPLTTYRQTGRTTDQMLAAPHGSVYVWCNQHLSYPKALARRHGREDLIVVSPIWLESIRLKGLELTGLVLDQATPPALTANQMYGAVVAQARVREVEAV